MIYYNDEWGRSFSYEIVSKISITNYIYTHIYAYSIINSIIFYAGLSLL